MHDHCTRGRKGGHGRDGRREGGREGGTDTVVQAHICTYEVEKGEGMRPGLVDNRILEGCERGLSCEIARPDLDAL